METITGRANPKIKYAAALKKNAFRHSEGKILVEGLRLCSDVALNGVEIEQCFVTAKTAQSEGAKVVLQKAQECFLIEEHIALKLADTKNPQGIFCVCKKPALSQQASEEGKYILLENVMDPGNLGTALRTAEAFGLSGAILIGCCDAFSPKAMRAAMGATFRFKLFEDNEYTLLHDLLSKGVPLYCAVVQPQAEDVRILRGKKALITAVGNEANGLSETLLQLGKHITIHMAGRAESLNASQAATVLMYEMSL